MAWNLTTWYKRNNHASSLIFVGLYKALDEDKWLVETKGFPQHSGKTEFYDEDEAKAFFKNFIDKDLEGW